MSVPSAYDVAQWVIFGALLPAICLWLAVEAALRYAERRARIRAARAGVVRSNLGARWEAHQEQRQAARQLRDGRA